MVLQIYRWRTRGIEFNWRLCGCMYMCIEMCCFGVGCSRECTGKERCCFLTDGNRWTRGKRSLERKRACDVKCLHQLGDCVPRLHSGVMPHPSRVKACFQCDWLTGLKKTIRCSVALIFVRVCRTRTSTRTPPSKNMQSAGNFKEKLLAWVRSRSSSRSIWHYQKIDFATKVNFW